MDFSAFLEELRRAPEYADQILHVHQDAERPPRYARTSRPLDPAVERVLRNRGAFPLYSHQARAIDLVREGRNVLVATGTASGKSLCYVAPVLEALAADPRSRALLLFPTKALCQDQFRAFGGMLAEAGLTRTLAGVLDGDTPGPTRRKLRDQGSVVFTNPDMLHAGLMPQHARWAEFLTHLKLLVLDELHVYSGIFGSGMANLLRRFRRVCGHYGAEPRVVACSATIANPLEMAERLLGAEVSLVDEDGSPRGRRTYVFWNPPRVRSGAWRSRRSANVEAHELMAALIRRGVPTIAFSKAKMTAEMIHRYVTEALRATAPHLADRVAPYRGGYRAEERREIEGRLFRGELLGVSATRALELGIDVGGLDASIIVGYPGTLVSFLQQSGRAGRRSRDSLSILVGLDTPVNQYVMSHPEYVFGRPVERGVIDADNPYVVASHLGCAAQELPLAEEEAALFGPHARTALRVLEGNHKVRRIGDRWYHASPELPQHEVSLRGYADSNVVIQDVDTGAALGEMLKFDASPILHPEAIYLHHGETYRVLDLDLERNLCRVKREEVDYYTQPVGGTDVHHIDHCLREKPFGTGSAYWGEVTAYFRNVEYERIRFYSLDAVSRHAVDLPTFMLDTTALWIVPPEPLMEEVRRAGLDAFNGLRGIGYATRMLLPLFITCDTLDFSHSVGSANSPWHTVFIYERYPHGLGFTEKAYDLLGEVLPAVLEALRRCPCRDGCPCCVGKPLRQYTTWNVERGEGSIPSKAAARRILEGLLGEGTRLHCPDVTSAADARAEAEVRLERSLRRRIERHREPQLLHPIEPRVPTEFPRPEPSSHHALSDAELRAERRRQFDRELRKRFARHLPTETLSPGAPVQHPPPAAKRPGGANPPIAFPGRPEAVPPTPSQPPPSGPQAPSAPPPAVELGDSLASRARKLRKAREGE